MGDAQWLQFFDGLPVALFAVDADGRPAFANQQAVDLLGRGILPGADAAAQAAVSPAFVAGTDEPYPPQRMPILRALAAHITSMATDIELLRDGRRVPIEAWASPIFDDDGVLRYAVATFYNIEARRQAEAERTQRLAAEAELAERQRFAKRQARFINHVAHQLYTPMTPLIINLQLLCRDADPAIAAATMRSVDALRCLVDQVVDVARVGDVNNRIEGRMVSGLDVVHAATLEVAAQAAKAGVTIEVGQHDALVLGDEHMLVRGVNNMLINAIEASPRGGVVTVGIEAAADGARDGLAWFTVRDEGAGWGEADQGRLFTPFGQLPESTQATRCGWGLGLYAVRLMANRHGGDVRAESAGPGQGAEVAFGIPRVPPEAKAD